MKAQSYQCLGCNEDLDDVEFDHVVPLGLGGGNDPDNWAALCVSCHASKTRTDLHIIAKAKRQRRYYETGRGRARRGGRFRRGFDRSHRRHVDGAVTRRCTCALCRGK
ncbi:MAG: HNH endonuclease [Hyphomonadaceae bacterium]